MTSLQCLLGLQFAVDARGRTDRIDNSIDGVVLIVEHEFSVGTLPSICANAGPGRSGGDGHSVPEGSLPNGVSGRNITDDETFARVYRELRSIAHRIRSGNPQETINTTALVHEAWLRLNQGERRFQEHGHYLCTAAVAMRQILVDYARYRGAAKRDREQEIPLFECGVVDQSAQSAEEILAFDQALDSLERLDQRAAWLVMLRFFAGLPVGEAAEVLDISPRSAARDWARGRAFLKTHLKS